MFGPFLRNARGNLILIFALSASVLVIFIGLAVDYGRILNAKENLQRQTDAVVLSLGKSGLTVQDDMHQHALNFLRANPNEHAQFREVIILDGDNGRLTVKVLASIRTSFMATLGFERVEVVTKASIQRGARKLELVMVIDQSSSMYMNGGWKVLQKAAVALVDELTFVQLTPEHVQVSLVPYGTTVNIKGEQFDMAWMDTGGKSQFHGAAFERDGSENQVNIFDLFDRIPNAQWRGCIEQRPGHYFISDLPPVDSDPNSLFVPYFAPDESDKWPVGRRNINQSGRNNYLRDEDAVLDEDERRGGNRKDSLDQVPLDLVDGFDNVTIEQKYDGDPFFDEIASEYRGGPNANCYNLPVIPLTTDLGKIKDAARAMTRPYSWGTNHAIGLIWGLRVLSPSQPYTGGAEFGDKDTVKIVVMMTDGASSPGSTGTPTISAFSAFGYAAEGRRGLTNTNQLRAMMEADTQAACSLIKKNGVLIYTFTFKGGQREMAQMRKCASSDKHAYSARDPNGFVDAFKEIGKNASAQALRLVE
jgi:hypothetical protein